MIRSVASLARRVAGSPDRLARGFAVLAVLVAAAAALLAGPAQAHAGAVGPSCLVGTSQVSMISGTAAPEARRTIFDRTDIGAADIEAPGDLGLPRAPTEAARSGHAVAASYGYGSDAAPVPAPDGWPHRPPRAA